MSKFIKSIEKVTGKKVIITTMSVTHDEREDVGILHKLAAIFKRSIWHGTKYKKGKKIQYVTTGDLGVNNKLRSDYLKHRQQKKKKRDEPKGYGWVD